MKFTALPVKVGDSFLLEDDNFSVLVDSGMNQNHIISLLNKKRIKLKHINIFICTHYDADHLNGIIGLLKSTYSFDELWLPEIFGSLSYTMTKKMKEINKLFNESIKTNEVIDNVRLSHYETSRTKDDNDVEKIDINLLEKYNKYHYFFPFYVRFNEDISEINAKMLINLRKINNLIIESSLSGSFIRWFKYTDNEENNLIRDNLFANNSIQTSISIYDPELFYKILYLTTINKQSLVFSYEKEGRPNVLFTADSDLSFVKGKIYLVENSIVTAPHHGSEENNHAYSKIHGDNLIFCRSDRSQRKRPGTEYLKQKLRYCTICRNRGSKKEIIFEYKKGKLVLPKNKCTC